jgi:hypothetical protein
MRAASLARRAWGNADIDVVSGTKLSKLIGQSMSALPGYFRPQFAPNRLHTEIERSDASTIAEMMA